MSRYWYPYKKGQSTKKTDCPFYVYIASYWFLFEILCWSISNSVSSAQADIFWFPNEETTNVIFLILWEYGFVSGINFVLNDIKKTSFCVKINYNWYNQFITKEAILHWA